MSQFPSLIQVCLLFDRQAPFDLEELVARFLAEERPISYNRVFDTRPGLYYRLFGQNDAMVTIEYLPNRADVEKFAGALAMPLNLPGKAELQQRIDAHKTVVLINVHHGAIPPIPEIAALLSQMNLEGLAGGNLDAYKQRLRIAARLGVLACELGRPTLVHWTTTHHLLREDAFRAFAAEPIPSLLHVQPLPFGDGEDSDGAPRAGVGLFGAAHFLGRDLRVAASRIPWPDTLASAVAFLRVATANNGYVVPDGDTFSPEDGSQTFRVRHLRSGPRCDGSEGPIYLLEPLDFPAHNFRAPDIIPRDFSFVPSNPPAAITARLGQNGAALAREWREKQRVANAAGVDFNIKYDPAKLPPVERSLLRRMFSVVRGGRA